MLSFTSFALSPAVRSRPNIGTVSDRPAAVHSTTSVTGHLGRQNHLGLCRRSLLLRPPRYEASHKLFIQFIYWCCIQKENGKDACREAAAQAAKVDRKLKQAQLAVSDICGRARNSYSKGVLKKDFKDGLLEMEETAADVELDAGGKPLL